MIDTRIVKSANGTTSLCETYSNENYKLKQIETNYIYGSSVIDLIDHYENGKPKSRFIYVETDILDIEEKITEGGEVE